MSLTDAEKDAIRSNFAVLADDLGNSMVLFYQILLTDFPQYKTDFEAVRDVRIKDFTRISYFRERQGLKTGKAFAAMVNKMDDMDDLRSIVQGMVDAPQHKAINLGKDDYDNAFKTLMKTLNQIVGADNVHKAAWKKLIKIILAMM